MRDDPFGWVGETIDGKYRVDAVVGEGGFGVVYKAQHLGFDGPVAIKCLKLPRNLSPSQREHIQAAFLAEGQLLHRLSRANAGIVQALDVGGASAPVGVFTPYLALEWLEGVSLEEDLATRLAAGAGPRALSEALALLEPAFSALATAHAEGIAHRDVKPANLFLALVGGRRTLKVLDFGIAKVLGETLSLTQAMQSTGGGEQAFTPQYAAPEQFDRGFGATGPWTDVYALALVLVEVATARPALDGESVAQLFLCTSNRDARPTFRRHGLAVSDSVEAVIEHALAVDPRSRYVNAAVLFDALVAALGVSRTELAPQSRGSLSEPRGSRPDIRATTPWAPLAMVDSTPMSSPTASAAALGATDQPVMLGTSLLVPRPAQPGPFAPGPQARHADLSSSRATQLAPPNGVHLRAPREGATSLPGGRRHGLWIALPVALLGAGLCAVAGLTMLQTKTPRQAVDRDLVRSSSTAPRSIALPSALPLAPKHSLFASLAGNWTSDTGRAYEAVAAEGTLEFRIRNAEPYREQGYFAGDVRFALTAAPTGGPEGPFVVRDVLRPFPPEGMVYDMSTGSSSAWSASQARATCVGTWTAVDDRPLSASWDGSRLVVELVKVFPTRAMFDVVGRTVLDCRGLLSAPVTRVRSVLRRQ